MPCFLGIFAAVKDVESSGQDCRRVYYGGWSGFTSAGTMLTMSGSPWGSEPTTVRYPLNSKTVAVGSDNTWDANSVLTAYHTGGINVLMTDGGVKFLSENIDFETLSRLSVKDDGQFVGEF